MKRMIALLLIFAAAACGITDASVSVRLDGTVTAQATGQPVPGARIELVNIAQAIVGGGNSTIASVLADAQGRYSLSRSIECLDYILGIGATASATGYASASSEIQCDDNAQTINFVLPPPPGP